MMNQYLIKTLVGFFLVVATSHVASGRSMTFLRSLAEEAEMSNQDPMEDTNINPENALIDTHKEAAPKGVEKKSFRRKFVTVELEGVHHGHTIKQGESYELLCNVDANPQAEVHWIRGENPTKQIEALFKSSVPAELTGVDEAMLSRLQSKYIIDCASPQDQGPIHCVAIAGQKMSVQSTQITIKENRNGTHSCKNNRPPVITRHMSAVFSPIGSMVILPCQAVGMPRPQTHWVDEEGRDIVNHHYNPRYMVLPNGDLLIENLEWSDMGGPTCTAESTSGIARAETFLYPVKREE